MKMEAALNFPVPKYIYIMILIDTWSYDGEMIHISIMNQFK